MRLRGGAFAFVALLVALLAPVGAQAATFPVTKGTDTNDGTCNADCSLREAVNAANASATGDVILLPAGSYTLSIGGAGEDAGATGDLDIPFGGGFVEIRGTGAGPSATTINATGLGDRILDILSSGEARISNLTLRGGTAPDGGAIQTESELTVRRVAFEANTATSNGGAVYSNDDVARTTIEDSLFSGNSAPEGGAIYNQDAATMVVASTTFSGQVAGDRGGAIYNQNDAAFTLLDSVMQNNQAADDGGAIFTQNTSSFSILRSALTGNRAGSAGGGIFVQNDSALSIVESSIDGNTAAGTAASDGGGAIYANNDSALLIERSTISGNRSEGDAGGISRNNDGQLLLRNSTVSGNSAAGNGGGLIFDAQNGAAFTAVENSTITANTATGLGGGVYNEGDPTLESGFRASIIAGNTAGGVANDCATDGVALFVSNGFNLDGTGTCALGAGTDRPNADPALGPLEDNGGATLTHALLPNSQAVDAGGGACPPIDQRELPRPQGAACDIGAYELIPDTKAPKVTLGGAKKQRAGKLAVKVSCDEDCTATVSGKVTVKAGKGKSAKQQKFKLKRQKRTIAAGGSATVKLKVKGKKSAQKLEQAMKRGAGTAKVKATALDPSGNKGSAKRSIVLKP